MTHDGDPYAEFETAPVARRALAAVRRHLVAVVTTAAAILVLATGIFWYVYAGSYKPLQTGGFRGPASNADKAKLTTSTDSTTRIVGGAGTEVRWTFAISNDGPVGVHVDGIVLTPLLVHAQWATFTSTPAGSVRGADATWHDFGSAPLPSHKLVRIAVTLRQPDCADRRFEGTGFAVVTVKWTSMARSHKTLLTVDPGSSNSILFCPFAN